MSFIKKAKEFQVLIAIIIGVLTITGFFVAYISRQVSASNDLEDLKITVDAINEDHRLLGGELNEINIRLAVQDNKLDAIKEDVTEIKEIIKNG